VTAAEFLERFGHFVDAPDGIKRLRESVLQLAVRGKLVAQDHQELLPPTYAALPTHPNLPPSWRFLNFGHYCDLQGGSQPPKSTFVTKPQEGYVRLLQIRDLGDKPVPVFIPADSTKRFCREGEILIARYGASVGKIFWAQDGAYNVALAKFLWPSDSFIAEFVFLLLKSTVFQAHLEGASRSAQAGFNKKDLASINFPLPPLAEQHRIVAKVDELMVLCDKLEAEHNTRDDTHTRLIRAAHHPLTAARDVASTATAWRRICDNFADLYTTRGSVQALRQTILQLAVQGKLVPSDEGDEPADETVHEMRIQKSNLIQAGAIKKQKAIPPLAPTDTPPIGSGKWAWAALDDIVEVVGGVTKGRRLQGRTTASFPYLRVANVQRAHLDLSVIKEIEIPTEELEKYRLQPGDLLITEGGDWDKVGRTAIWSGEIDNCLHQNHVFRARLFHSMTDNRFLMLYLNSPISRGYFAKSLNHPGYRGGCLV